MQGGMVSFCVAWHGMVFVFHSVVEEGMIWFGVAWYGMAWYGGSAISYIVRWQVGKESAVLSSRHWLQKAPPPPPSSKERLMAARWQIDFDRRERDAGISGIGHCSTAWCHRLQHIVTLSGSPTWEAEL